jgi:drug/metabolite transporter (DMT)-like permease
MVLLFLAYLCLATAISTNKVILFALSPELLVGIRMVVAAVFLVAYSVLAKHERVTWPHLKNYGPTLIVVAFFTTFFPSNLKAYALAHMPSSKMAFFGTLDPFVAACYSYLVYGERLTVRKWLGIGLGFVGMLVLIFSTSPLEEQLKAFSVVSYPELAAFWAIVLSRLGWISAQQLLKKDIVSPVQLNTMTMGIGGVLSLSAAFIRQQTTITSLALAPLTLLATWPFNLVSPEGQLAGFLSYTIIVGNMIGYTLYASMLKRYSVTFIALTSFSIPLMVHALGWLFLNEQLSASFMVACLITFSGLVLFFLEER